MRRLVWFAGGFGLACLAACYGFGGVWLALAALALCGGATALWYRTRPAGWEVPDPDRLPVLRRRLFQICRRGAALLLGVALAFGWFAGYEALFYAPAHAMAGSTRAISGTVSSYPRETSIGGWSMTVRLDGGVRAPDVLLYGSEDWAGLEPGDRVKCEARLRSADRMRGEETTYYTAKGVFLLAYCDDPPEVERAEGVPFRFWPALWARELRAGIYAAFDDIAAPLAAAVTIGDKSGLDEQSYSALSRSGVTHAAVVSGMHISFLVTVLLFLCRGRRGVALCLIPVLLFYALMAGGTPSAFRAVIMQAALLAAPVLGREGDPPCSLALALLVLLVQNPYAAASVSLQLSFGAVVGILLVSGRLMDWLLRPCRARLRERRGLHWRVLWQGCRFIAASLSASLGAMLFTTPLVALYFGQIAIAGPLTNILVLWAVTALMISALVVGTLAIFLPQVMAAPGMVFGLLGHYIHGVVTVIGAWPLAALDAGQRSFQVWLAAAYLQLPAVALNRQRRWRAVAAWVAGLAILLGAAVGFNAWSVAGADLTVTALDVGQGASTLFLSGGQAALVDCGGSGSDSAGDVAADQLASMGRSTLDLLVLTHLDADHFNGVAQLMYRLEVRQVATPDVATHRAQLAQLRELARQEGAELIIVDKLYRFPLGKATLTLYPPLSAGASNEEGLFALCSAGDFDTLITGDADSFVERMLIKYVDLPDIELLMVGHHGSDSSACTELLDDVRAELAVISVGGNSNGHPRQEVLDRLAGAGATVYRTDRSGHVTVRVRDGRVAVTG